MIRQFFENAWISAEHAEEELGSYEHKRRGLRVTQPRNRVQRDSYLLSLPISKAIKLILAGAVLHWWLGIFLSLEILHVYPVGDSEPWVQAAVRSASVMGNFLPHALAWWKTSKTGIGAATAVKKEWGLAVAIAYILIPVVLLGLPLIIHGVMIGHINKGRQGTQNDDLKGGANSWTLSWVCHPPEEEGDISEKKIRIAKIYYSDSQGNEITNDGPAAREGGSVARDGDQLPGEDPIAETEGGEQKPYYGETLNIDIANSSNLVTEARGSLPEGERAAAEVADLAGEEGGGGNQRNGYRLTFTSRGGNWEDSETTGVKWTARVKGWFAKKRKQ